MAKSITAADRKLFLEIVRLHGVEKLEFGEIGIRLGMNSRYVRRLLRQAEGWLLAEHRRLAQGEGPDPSKSPLELELLKKYPHLKKVEVVPGGEIDSAFEYAALIKRWGTMAAAYLDQQADDAAVSGRKLNVCMSGGETILEAMNSLPERRRENVFFFTSVFNGRAHMVNSAHIDPIVNATVAWSRSGRVPGRCIYATVTPYDLHPGDRAYGVRRKEIQAEIDNLCGISLIERHLKVDLDEMDMAFAGLGMTVPPPKFKREVAVRLSATDLLKATTHIDPEDVAREGAIGEIGCCYFDKNGQGDNDKWRFYLTAGDLDPKRRGVAFYREMVKAKKDVIVIAGPFKEPAMIAALKGKLFNVWFTNENAARNILRSK
jgi:DNA-binding transcriptional regulator LsrR (DeoR family)